MDVCQPIYEEDWPSHTRYCPLDPHGTFPPGLSLSTVHHTDPLELIFNKLSQLKNQLKDLRLLLLCPRELQSSINALVWHLGTILSNTVMALLLPPPHRQVLKVFFLLPLMRTRPLLSLSVGETKVDLVG